MILFLVKNLKLRRYDPVVNFRLTMFYNYVLKNNKNNKLYVGYATDLKKRLKEHNQGKSQATKAYKPWNVIYYEACLEESDARRREYYLKTTQGLRLLKCRLKDYFYSEKSKNNL